MRIEMDVGPGLSELASVRDAISERPGAWGAAPPVDPGIVSLLLNELVVNAMEHGAPPISVTVDWDPVRLRVEVVDGSDELPALRQPSAGDVDGRGIWLVDRLSSAWGVDHLAGGKVVWFELGC